MYSRQAASVPLPDEPSRAAASEPDPGRADLAYLHLAGAQDRSAPDLSAQIAEVQALLLQAPEIEEFLHELAVLAARRVASGLSCGITLQVRGRPLTVASSDAFAEQVDEIQYGVDDGPCLSAMRTGKMVSVEDTSGEPRWAGFEARAAERGVGSSLSLPLIADDHFIGALNLYARTAGALGPAQLRTAKSLAAAASGALSLAVRQAEQTDLNEQLRAALTSRAVIDQALGIIMAQQRCTSAVAFDLLRSASQNRNVKLRQVAADIVTSVTGEAPQAGPFRDFAVGGG